MRKNNRVPATVLGPFSPLSIEEGAEVVGRNDEISLIISTLCGDAMRVNPLILYVTLFLCHLMAVREG